VLTIQLDSYRVLRGSETYMIPKSTFCCSVWKFIGERVKYPLQSLSQRLNSALLHFVNCFRGSSHRSDADGMDRVVAFGFWLIGLASTAVVSPASYLARSTWRDRSSSLALASFIHVRSFRSSSSSFG
jgi:hypothetical protein